MCHVNRPLSKAIAMFFLAVLLMATITGCTAPTGTEQNVNKTISSANQDKSSVEPPFVNLAMESLGYPDEDKALLLYAMAKAGLNVVYIPSKSDAKSHDDEGVIEVRRWEGGLSILFKHFLISQSLEMPLQEEYINSRAAAELDISPAEWIRQGTADPVLYMQLGDVHLVIEPTQHMTKANVEAIAESLLPLTESDLPKKEDKLQVEQDYMMALRVANQFLEAWVHRDGQQGAQTVTTEVKDAYSAEQLSAYFVGVSNPHHQAYEITGSDKIDENTYRFKVWMYEHYTGVEVLFDHPEPSYLTVTRTSDNQWLVNELP